MMKTSKPEYARVCHSIQDAKENNAVQRYYIGSEFCETNIPSTNDLSIWLAYAREEKKQLTFLTPFVTEKGLTKARVLLDFLKNNAPGSEVVVNDWGILFLIAKEYAHMRIILGRIIVSHYLNRFHHDEWVRHSVHDEQSKRYYCLFPDAFLSFTKKYSIHAFEFNAHMHLHLTREQLTSKGIKAHIYTPFSYLTVTRHCRYPRAFQPCVNEDINTCNRECIDRIAVIKNKKHVTETIIQGNARFAIRDSKNVVKGADRIIYNHNIGACIGYE